MSNPSEPVEPNDRKHLELWNEIRRVRDRVHEHGTFLAVLKTRVDTLEEEIERKPAGASPDGAVSSKIMLGLVALATVLAQGLFKIVEVVVEALRK
jgi:hypothetical protein